MRRLYIFLSVFLTFNVFAQELSKEEIVNFKSEGEQLIAYLQFTLNAIGDNELSPKEKEIIISESFIKMFRDEKVQIEDDLDASREAVTNKDVQAYLKDVDFFFRYADFTFNVLSIDVQSDEDGNPFLLTNILRTLNAIDINGDTVKNEQQRFIEIEIDSEKRELKIASIYTTKLNENEENIRWWNLLPEAWKSVLGNNTIISDTIAFSSFIQLNEDYLVVEAPNTADIEIINDSLAYTDINFELESSIPLYNYDTIWINDTNQIQLKESVFKSLNNILEISDLYLNGNFEILDLEPINRLRNLRTLDISSTQIQDIYPVRNLTNLHMLNCSNTFVNSIDALIYSMELAVLNISNTNVNNIDALGNLSNLIILDISNTAINNLEACAEMNILEDLKMRNTLILDLSPLASITSLNYLDLSNNEQLSSLEPLNELNQLKVLYCNNTLINDLTPLSALSNLETIYCENTEITNLNGLELLPNLRKIYCDNSMLGRQKAIDFMKEHPHILVLYESKQLQMWWAELPEVWKTVFAEIVEPDAIPSIEQLHEITTISEVNIAGNTLITSLLPLDKLKNLQKLNASSTSINNLDGIGEAREMRELNISNTNIHRLYSIENLNLIEVLSVSLCQVKDLSPLQGMINLKSLNINNTPVYDLKVLEKLQNLRYIQADSTLIERYQFEDFIENKDDILLIYQSSELTDWWVNLEPAWSIIFKSHMQWNQEPSVDDLHKLIQIQSLVVTENRSILNLNPAKKLKHLRKLRVNDTRITDVSPLRNLSYLKEVDLSRNPITDLSPLQSLSNLEFIYLNNTPINSLEWLLDLPKIKILDISGTEIKYLRELYNSIQLEKLIAYNTKIRNIKPLEKLPNLILLKIYNSRVSSKNIAEFKQINPDCAIDYY